MGVKVAWVQVQKKSSSCCHKAKKIFLGWRYKTDLHHGWCISLGPVGNGRWDAEGNGLKKLLILQVMRPVRDVKILHEQQLFPPPGERNQSGGGSVPGAQ